MIRSHNGRNFVETEKELLIAFQGMHHNKSNFFKKIAQIG